MQEHYRMDQPVRGWVDRHASCTMVRGRSNRMLFTIAVILLILWLLGFATHVVGSIIHVVLVIAIVLFLIGLFTGRRTTV